MSFSERIKVIRTGGRSEGLLLFEKREREEAAG
jgi:hypothetical protein